MQCEWSDGSTWNVTDAATLESRIRGTGIDEHVILSDDRMFMQYAHGSTSGELQYGDGDRLFSCTEALPIDRVAGLFAAFYRHDESWRSAVPWSPMEGSPGSPGAEEGIGNTHRAGSSNRSRSFVETITDDAAAMLKRKAGNLVRRGIRKFLG